MITTVASLYNSEAIHGLLQTSERHASYTEEEAVNLIMPAIILRQALLFWEGQTLVGYVSMAFMDEQTSVAFEQGQHRLTPADWVSGREAWIIDMVVAPDYEMVAYTCVVDYLKQQGHHHVRIVREKGSCDVIDLRNPS